MKAATEASARAKRLAATALSAAVRIAVIQPASMQANGKPVSLSITVISPLICGSPRSEFRGLSNTDLTAMIGGSSAAARVAII